MKYIGWLLVSILLIQGKVMAQVLPVEHAVRISLLTCSPGEELYSSFGHTAIRVQDSSLHTDYVFNYGTFNFDQPNFYLKFVRGKLEFMLSIQTFEDFLYEYQVTQRSVSEQVLELTTDQKTAITQFLSTNYMPANRTYKYDFLYDNCATRIRDILFKEVNGIQLTKSLTAPGTSFRDLIYNYLDKGGQPWSKLGIDILLGSPVDKQVDNATAMFLPDYLSAGVKHATIAGKPYEAAVHQIIDVPSPVTPTGKYVPLVLIIIISAILLLVYYFLRGQPGKLLIIDSILLYITGLLGLLLLFMWFATDHQACAWNYNLLWAMPLNLMAGFFIWKKRSWLRKYFLIMMVLMAVLIAFWWGMPQYFNIALLPFCILLLVRYGQLAKK